MVRSTMVRVDGVRLLEEEHQQARQWRTRTNSLEKGEKGGRDVGKGRGTHQQASMGRWHHGSSHRLNDGQDDHGTDRV